MTSVPALAERVSNYPPGVASAAARRGMTPEAYQQKRAAGLKWCRDCQEWRPTADYQPSVSRHDKLQPLCRRHLTPRTRLTRSHGASRYVNDDCRCDVCRKAHADRCREARERRRLDPAAADRAGHGKRSTYSNYGCRCNECRQSDVDYRQDALRRRAAK